MAMPSGQRRHEFSFPGSSPARGGAEIALPQRQRGNPLAPRAGEEDSRWLQASRLGSPDSGSGGSGTPSPQLWAHHQNRLYPASAGTSPSRAQAIAGYRREMLDLVRGLPESTYELSLRDIVESPSLPQPPPPPRTNASAQEQEEAEPKKDVAAATADEEAKKQSSGGGAKKQGKGKARQQRTMGRTRSRSLERGVIPDTGLLIKLFLPLSIGGKKKVSPKPVAAKDGKKKKKRQGKKDKEEEWWKKSEFSEAESSSRTSSTSSSSSRNRNGNGSTNPKAPTRSRSRKRIGCYGFFRANKRKNGVNQE